MNPNYNYINRKYDILKMQMQLFQQHNNYGCVSSDVDHLETEISNQSQAISEEKKKQDEEAAKLQELKNKLNELISEIESIDNENSQITLEAQNNQKKCDETKREAKETEIACNLIHKNNKQLDGRINSLKEGKHELKSKLLELTGTITDKQNEKTRLVEEINEISQSNKNLLLQVSKTERNLQDKSVHLEGKRDTLKKSKSRSSFLASDIEKLRSDIKDSENSVVNETDSIRELQNTKQRLIEQIQRQKEENDKTFAEINECRKKIDDRNSAIKRLDIQIKGFSDTLNQEREQSAEISAELTKAATELAEKNVKFTELGNQLKLLETEKENKSNEFEKIRKERTTLNERKIRLLTSPPSPQRSDDQNRDPNRSIDESDAPTHDGDLKEISK
ncbi:hypothetical protein TVAG_056650 [Trichomonas vaginalis G3]|uniref:Uncharacterized protein n=1 Tax=Trichomonas vaginalis (strain ATCC PRA-98 / G3) TaxID=412133 RepID=A2ECM4_TRIV3|nr:hypothetical protein TVAGG3_0882150 [Trichomonas vaginalis G3]EAY09621.1 hypothetical protein TVAG_056650 [Trichomonas vaginalis G3]KAI5502132.1 hypothetical protein TVAGG3_0882150 [Trichomonas vaginalis G3]|eukprot:XP_001321844.1 hypothetical protein [Trichomonas vaginalis G3]